MGEPPLERNVSGSAWAPDYNISQVWTLILMVCLSPIFLAGIYSGHKDVGAGTYICSAMIVVVGRIYWGLRNHAWFWIVMILAALLQIPFVLYVPWLRFKVTFLALLPIGLFDYAAIAGALRLAFKISMRHRDVRTK